MSHFSHGAKKDEVKLDACFGEHLAIETLYYHESWVAGMVHTLNWTLLFLLGCAYPEEKKNISKLPGYPEEPGCRAVDAFSGVAIPPVNGVSKEWAVLPGEVLSDLVFNTRLLDDL